VVMAQGQPEKASRLYGAAAALRAGIGSVIDPADQAAYDSQRAALRAALGPERFAAAREDGRAMTLEQAVAYARENQASHVLSPK